MELNYLNFKPNFFQTDFYFFMKNIIKFDKFPFIQKAFHG